MTEFTIMEDFPKSEIEFDQRFLDESACFDYLFKMKWPDGFSCTQCGHRAYCGDIGDVVDRVDLLVLYNGKIFV